MFHTRENLENKAFLEYNILYVNGAYQGDSDIGRLMHDFRCCDAKDMYFEEMKEITHHFKETEEGVEYMCRAFEETRDAARYQEKISLAVKLIKSDKDTFEEVAELTGLPLETVQDLAGVKTA